MQVPATKHSERIAEALAGPQSGIVLVDDLDAGLRVVDAYAAEHLEIQTRDAREVAAAGAQRRRDLRRARGRRCRLGDYAAGLQPRAAHRRLRLPLVAGCPCRPSCAASTSSTTTRHALRDVAARTWSTLADAEDLPGHAAAVAGARSTGPRAG